MSGESSALHLEMGYLFIGASMLSIELERRLCSTHNSWGRHEYVHTEVAHGFNDARVQSYVVDIPFEFIITPLENL